jgi:hypothetical protein
VPIAIGSQNPTRLSPPAGPGFVRHPTVIGAVSGLSEMAFGAGFLVTWIQPSRFGVTMVKFALELMLLEFILIHSAGFMGLKASAADSWWRRVGWFAGIGAFYSLFVVGFCLALDTWRPMVTFWIITAQRLVTDLLDPKPSEETRAWFTTGLALNVVLYIGGAMLTVLLPLPRLGVTRGVRDELGIGGSGLWQSEPHRVVVLAALYYLARGYFTATARPRKTWPATVQ